MFQTIARNFSRLFTFKSPFFSSSDSYIPTSCRLMISYCCTRYKEYLSKTLFESSFHMKESLPVGVVEREIDKANIFLPT